MKIIYDYTLSPFIQKFVLNIWLGYYIFYGDTTHEIWILLIMCEEIDLMWV